MPLTPPPAASRKNRAQLVALTAVVLLAHVGVLYGTPAAWAPQPAPADAIFATRMIVPAPASSPPPAFAPTDPPAPRPSVPRALPRSAREVTAPRPADPEVSVFATPAPQAVSTVDAANTSGGASVAASPPPSTDSTLLAAADLVAPTGTGSATVSPSGKPPATKAAAQNFAFPPPLHLKYKINGEVKGFAYYVNGDLQWKHDAKTYEARMEVSHFLLGSRVQTSRGELGPTGLEPIRFGDKTRSERAAHFERSKGKVSFSANSPDAPLVPGTQDQLSTLLQLGSLLGGAPASFPEGTLVPFESVGPTSVESWVFKVGGLEKLSLPGGPLNAIKLTREAVGDYGTRADVWLAPSMGYLPVRIRLTEPNGNFVDQQWSDTVAP